MQRRVFILLWCLFCLSFEAQGQKTRNITKAVKAVVTHPYQKMLVRLPKAGSSTPAKMCLLSADTPEKLNDIINQMKTNKGCRYVSYNLPRIIKKGDALNLQLYILDHQDEYDLENTKQVISYDDKFDNSALFKFKKTLSLPYLQRVNYAFSISVNNEPRPILTDEIETDSEVERHNKKPLFDNKDSLLFWKNEFISFLDAHGNEYKDENGKYFIDTSENNKVNQAFASFLKIWLDNKTITDFSGPACWRFLISDSQIYKNVEPDSWRNWFLNWFNNSYRYKAAVDLEDNIIHRNVKKWLEDNNLIKQVE